MPQPQTPPPRHGKGSGGSGSRSRRDDSAAADEGRAPQAAGGLSSKKRWSLGTLFKKTVLALRKPTKRKRRDAVQVANSVVVQQMCSEQVVEAIRLANKDLLPGFGEPSAPSAAGSPDHRAALDALGAHPLGEAAPAVDEAFTVEGLFERRQLHVRVVSAKHLLAANLDGTSDPFVVVRVCEETQRTAIARRRLDAQFAESFNFLGESVKQGGYVVEFEAWSFDSLFHPDDFLGQAEIDLRQLPLRDNSRPVKCTAKLYVLKRNGKKEAGDFGEIEVQVWTTPQDAKAQFLSTGLWGTVPNITPEIMSLCAAKKQLPTVNTNMLGTLYEEPCIAYIKVSLVGITGLFEALSSTPPPSVCPITGRLLCTLNLGCPYRARLTASGRQSGTASSETPSSPPPGTMGGGGSGDGGGRAEPSGGSSGGAGGAALTLLRNTVQSMLPLATFRKWGRGDSMHSSDTGSSRNTDSTESATGERFLVAGLPSQRRRRHSGSSMPSMPEDFNDEWDDSGPVIGDGEGDGGYGSPAEQQGAKKKDGSRSVPGPRQPYVYFKFTYAKQTHYSHLKRLSRLGDSTHDESFVFATVRPLVPSPLDVNVYLALNKKRKGKLISRTSYLMSDMVLACEDAPRTAEEGQPPPDLIKNSKWADRFALPVLRWPLEHLKGQLRMHVGLADADYRAAMYKVPLVDNSILNRELPKVMSAVSSHVLPRGDEMVAPDGTVEHSLGLLGQSGHGLSRGSPHPGGESPFATSNGGGGGASASGRKASLGGRRESVGSVAELLGIRRTSQASTSPTLSGSFKLLSPSGSKNMAKEVDATRSLSSVSATSSGSDVDSAWAHEAARVAAAAVAAGGGAAAADVEEGEEGEEVGDWLSRLTGVAAKVASRFHDDSKGAAAPEQLMPVGTLFLKLEQLEMSLPNLTHFALMKYGPHWCKAMTRHSGHGARGPADTRHFELRLPIYDPSDVLTNVSFVHRGGSASLTRKGKLDVYPFSRSTVSLSGLQPNVEVSRKITTPRMYKEDGTPFQWREGQSGYGTITVHVRLKVVYNDQARLLKTYLLRPPRPPAWYTLGLDDADRHLVDRQYRKIVSRWLESCSTPLPANCVKLLLATERDRFAMDVLKGNWRRLVQGMHWVLLLRDGVTHVMSWRSRCHSLAAYLLIVACCFFTTPALAILLGAAFLVMWGQRSRAYYGAHDPAVVVVEDDDDVVAPTSNNNPYADLKRKYEDIVALGLEVQNYLDDAACWVERLQSMHNWRDPVSTGIFTAAVGGATLAIYLLGLPLVMCGVLMWVLRPPVLRDPEPNPLENYFWRLPTLAALTRAARLKQVDGAMSASMAPGHNAAAASAVAAAAEYGRR